MNHSPWRFKLNTRTLLVMLLGLLLNGLFFLFAYNMKLPMILHTCGSLYVCLAAGPVAGVVVILLTALPLVLWVYSLSALPFVATTLLSLTLVGCLFQTGKAKTPLALLGLALVLYLCNVIVNTGIAMLFFAGKPYDFYSSMLFDILSAAGFSRIAASSMTNIVIRFFDTFLCCTIAGSAMFLTPREKKW